jgi:hypothetical protein
MSGVVDSGRKSGHGNIDANDPKRPFGSPAFAVMHNTRAI